MAIRFAEGIEPATSSICARAVAVNDAAPNPKCTTTCRVDFAAVAAELRVSTGAARGEGAPLLVTNASPAVSDDPGLLEDKVVGPAEGSIASVLGVTAGQAGDTHLAKVARRPNSIWTIRPAGTGEGAVRALIVFAADGVRGSELHDEANAVLSATTLMPPTRRMPLRFMATPLL